MSFIARERIKPEIAYVDIWDGLIDDQGRYVQDGPDFEGQTRRLRTYDGVNFTKAGRRSLGIMSNTIYAGCWVAICCLSRYRVQRSSHLRATMLLAARPSVQPCL